MIDIHGHFLPGIDDGASDLETAAAMCRIAAEDGCDDLIATPHQRHAIWPNLRPERLFRLRDRLQKAVGERPRIHLGAEIRIGRGLLDDLERLPASGLLALAGSRHLLLEYRRGASPADPEELIHELLVAGWTPILAHPEFIRFLAEDLALMDALARAGARFQLTASSLTGEYGRPVRRNAWAILDRGLAHFVASDAHGVQWRPPGLGRAFELIARRAGERLANELTRDNPAAILREAGAGAGEAIR